MKVKNSIFKQSGSNHMSLGYTNTSDMHVGNRHDSYSQSNQSNSAKVSFHDKRLVSNENTLSHPSMVSTYERSFGVKVGKNRGEEARDFSRSKSGVAADFKQVHMPTIKNHRMSDPDN